jgi:hypothetical protein
LCWDEGVADGGTLFLDDDGPALEVEDKEQRKIWRFLFPGATE